MLRHGTRAGLCVSLVCGMLLTAGCGKSEDDQRAELALWHIMTYDPPRQVLLDAVRRFEAAHPGVTVKVLDIQNDSFKQKLATEMAGGRLPDVFHTWGGGVLAAYARAGKVMDLTGALSEDAWRDSFDAAALGFCTDGGRVYAVPLDISVVPVWYNRGLFERLGLKPPGTFEELKAACGALKAEGVAPFALGNKDQWPGAFYFIYLATRMGGTALFERAARGEASFADRAFVAAGARLRELVEMGAFPEGFNGLTDAQARRQFFTGRAGMYVMGNWVVARCVAEAPEFMGQLDCFPFPAVAGGAGESGTIVGGTNTAFAVSSACKHPDLAIELLRELTSARVAGEWIKAGRLPAVGRRTEGAALAEPSRRALELLGAAPRIQLYYDQYLPPALAAVHKETTQAIFAGTMTPEQAAARMARAAEEGR